MSLLLSQVYGSSLPEASTPIDSGVFYSTAFEQGLSYQMLTSLYRMSEYQLSLDEDPITNPRISKEDANHYAQQEGLGHVRFDYDPTMDELNLVTRRQAKERDRQTILTAGNTGLGRMAGSMGVQFLGSLLSPVDLPLMFLPIVGSSARAAQAASPVSRVLSRGLVTEEALAARGLTYKGYTSYIASGVVGQAITEVPYFMANLQDQTPYTIEQFGTNLALGAAFGAAINTIRLGIKSIHGRLTPTTRENMMNGAQDDFLNGRDIDPARYVDLDDNVVPNKTLSETVRNFDEADAKFKESYKKLSPKQKEMFQFNKGNKLVDSQGLPIIVYHGRTWEGDTFDPSKLGSNTGAASAKQGFFFSGNAKTAQYYILQSKFQNDPRVSEIFDKMNAIQKKISKNPGRANQLLKTELSTLNKEVSDILGVDTVFREGGNIGAFMISMRNPKIVDFGGVFHRPQTYERILTEAKAAGHDGVVIKNTFDGGPLDDIYVSFDNANIRSAYDYRVVRSANEKLLAEQRALADYKAREDQKKAVAEARLQEEIKAGTMVDPKVVEKNTFTDEVSDDVLKTLDEEIEFLRSLVRDGSDDVDIDKLFGDVKSLNFRPGDEYFKSAEIYDLIHQGEKFKEALRTLPTVRKNVWAPDYDAVDWKVGEVFEFGPYRTPLQWFPMEDLNVKKANKQFDAMDKRRAELDEEIENGLFDRLGEDDHVHLEQLPPGSFIRIIDSEVFDQTFKFGKKGHLLNTFYLQPKQFKVVSKIKNGRTVLVTVREVPHTGKPGKSPMNLPDIDFPDVRGALKDQIGKHLGDINVTDVKNKALFFTIDTGKLNAYDEIWGGSKGVTFKINDTEVPIYLDPWDLLLKIDELPSNFKTPEFNKIQDIYNKYMPEGEPRWDIKNEPAESIGDLGMMLQERIISGEVKIGDEFSEWMMGFKKSNPEGFKEFLNGAPFFVRDATKINGLKQFDLSGNTPMSRKEVEFEFGKEFTASQWRNKFPPTEEVKIHKASDFAEAASILSPGSKSLFDTLFELDPSLKDIRIDFQPDLLQKRGAVGMYYGSYDRIGLHTNVSTQTVIHELIHASAVRRWRQDLSNEKMLSTTLLEGRGYFLGLEKYARTTSNKPMGRLVESYLAAVKHHRNLHFDIDTADITDIMGRVNGSIDDFVAYVPEPHYGLLNFDEFISEALTNRSFQLFLDSIPSSQNRTLLQDIVEWFRNLFDLKPGKTSVLNDVISDYSEMVKNGVRNPDAWLKDLKKMKSSDVNKPMLEKAANCILSYGT